MRKFQVNTIYPAYQGEVNAKGIGEPVIFLRLQGCHLRCYETTFGKLCDTPEGLLKTGGKEMSEVEILSELLKIRSKMGGTSYICLSGGDPLWRDPKDLFSLLHLLYKNNFEVSIETSGTISVRKFLELPNVTLVLDYKLKSAGIKQKFIIDEINCLHSKDYIKFVVYDNSDYEEFKTVLPQLQPTKAKIGVGVYWGGKIGTAELFYKLLHDQLLGKVSINCQLHKMVTYCDLNKDVLEQTLIPKEI